MNKSSGSQSDYRSLGSIDIAAAVRSILFVEKVEKEKEQDIGLMSRKKYKLNVTVFSILAINLLLLSHYLLDFSDFSIGLGINTRNGCEYVLYCKMFLCIQKSTYMHVYN